MFASFPVAEAHRASGLDEGLTGSPDARIIHPPVRPRSRWARRRPRKIPLLLSSASGKIVSLVNFTHYAGCGPGGCAGGSRDAVVVRRGAARPADDPLLRNVAARRRRGEAA